MRKSAIGMSALRQVSGIVTGDHSGPVIAKIWQVSVVHYPTELRTFQQMFDTARRFDYHRVNQIPAGFF
jgi:hypothetical protein